MTTLDFSIPMTDAQKREIEDLARRSGMSVQAYIERVLTDAVEERQASALSTTEWVVVGGLAVLSTPTVVVVVAEILRWIRG